MAKTAVTAAANSLTWAMKPAIFIRRSENKISLINTRHLQAIERCIHDGIQARDFRQNLDPAAIAKFILAEVNGSLVLAKVFFN